MLIVMFGEAVMSFFMAGVIKKLLKEHQDRIYYIPMLLYILYGLYFIANVGYFDILFYYANGYDSFTFYAQYLIVAEISVSIICLFRFDNTKAAKVMNICAVGMAVLLWYFFYKGEYNIFWMVSAVLLHIISAVNIVKMSGQKMHKVNVSAAAAREGASHKSATAVLGVMLVAGLALTWNNHDDSFVERVEEAATVIEGNEDFFADDNRSLLERCSDYLNSKQELFNGTIIIRINGEEICNVYGYADKDNGIRNDENSIYGISGATRQFTAAAILKLYNEGKLALDDTLDMYFPDYQYGSEITIENLLNMTSGIPDYMEIAEEELQPVLSFVYGRSSLGLYQDIDFRKIAVPVISYEPLQCVPGSRMAFSLSDYYLLGLIIEQVSGVSYSDYITENFLKPLGLENTYADVGHLNTVGEYYSYRYDVSRNSPYIYYSTIGIVSTPMDIIKWAEFITNAEEYAKIREINDITGMGYAMKADEDGYYYISENLGYDIIEYMIPDKEVYIVGIFNSNNGVSINPIEQLKEYIIEYMEEE